MNRIADQRDPSEMPMVEDAFFKTDEVSTESVLPEFTKYL